VGNKGPENKPRLATEETTSRENEKVPYRVENANFQETHFRCQKIFLCTSDRLFYLINTFYGMFYGVEPFNSKFFDLELFQSKNIVLQRFDD